MSYVYTIHINIGEKRGDRAAADSRAIASACEAMNADDRVRSVHSV